MAAGHGLANLVIGSFCPRVAPWLTRKGLSGHKETYSMAVVG